MALEAKRVINKQNKNTRQVIFISSFVKKRNLGRILFIVIHSLINSKSNELPQSLGGLWSLRCRFGLEFGKQTAAWRWLRGPDFPANEMKSNKDISSGGFFASRIGHPELDCEALSFLLQ